MRTTVTHSSKERESTFSSSLGNVDLYRLISLTCKRGAFFSFLFAGCRYFIELDGNEKKPYKDQQSRKFGQGQSSKKSPKQGKIADGRAEAEQQNTHTYKYAY